MTFTTRTFAQLCVSPLNVRKNLQDQTETRATEASIARIGLIYPLMVHPVTLAARAKYPDFAEWTDAATEAVFAGGRRLRAIGRLIAAGRLPADWPINCDFRELDPIRDAALITQISHAENFIGRDLRVYETHAAVRDAADRGAGVEEIADALDQTHDWVTRQLRLGRLHEPVFAAYAAGTLSYDQARAFAATEDPALQAAAWTHFAGKTEWERKPHLIRAFYRIGDLELERLLNFVGRDEYCAAGGDFERDLFSDANTADSGPVRVLDEGLLRDTAEHKLAAERARIRIAAERLELRFAEAPPSYAGGTDWSLLLEPPERPSKTGGAKVILPAGDVIATLALTQPGALELRWWWASRKAKAAARADVVAIGSDPGSGATTPAGTSAGPHAVRPDYDTTLRDFSNGQRARAAVKAEQGLTADGLQALRALRRALLRGVLLKAALGQTAQVQTALVKTGGAAPTLGRDYLTFTQLRHELRGDRAAMLGARALGDTWRGGEDAEPAEFVAPHLSACAAHQLFDSLLETLRAETFVTLDDLAAAFDAYLAMSEDDKTLAATLLACLALERSANVPGWRIPLHDALARHAGADAPALRQLWHPDAAFFGLFPKLKKLELVQGLADPAIIAGWAAHKDGIVAAACAEVTKPATHSDPERIAAAAQWLHPLLSFGVEPAPTFEPTPVHTQPVEVPQPELAA